MKTKILYVLVSDESDYYVEQFFISSFSLKYYNNDAYVVLLTDDKTDSYIKSKCKNAVSYVDEIIKVELPENLDNKKRSRYLKTTARDYFVGDFLFIDTDTLITSSLAGIDDYNYLIGAVYDLHCPLKQHFSYKEVKYKAAKIGYKVKDSDLYYNSGIMLVKDTLETRTFYKKWHYNYVMGNENGVFTDQQSLLKTNAEMNIICSLDSSWNCQIINNISNLCDAKIIHYFCTGIHKKNLIPPYELMGKTLCAKFRYNAYQVDSEIMNIVKNAKRLYATPVKIFSGEDLKIVYSLQFHLLVQFYYNFTKGFNFIEKVIAFIRKKLIK